MKKLIVFLICSLLFSEITAQSITGAWESYSIAENGDKLKSVVIFSDGYQVLTIYNATTGKFIHSNGGTWKIDGDTITEKVEFHTDIPQRIGTEVSFKVRLTETTFEKVSTGAVFNRIDNGMDGDLEGTWLMSGRVKEGKTELRDVDRPRKTMKILSETRFQWIAYNTETKKFIGTGGGTYTSIDGVYQENIEFFSKDNSKVGVSLKFDYELIEGKWNHKGKSSKGDPIHEIWSSRK